jgi:hypothetical protein
MCNRFGRCHKYVERTSYYLIAAIVLLVAALGSFINIGIVLFASLAQQRPMDLPWDVLAFAAIASIVGVILVIVAARRLR